MSMHKHLIYIFIFILVSLIFLKINTLSVQAIWAEGGINANLSLPVTNTLSASGTANGAGSYGLQCVPDECSGTRSFYPCIPMPATVHWEILGTGKSNDVVLTELIFPCDVECAPTPLCCRSDLCPGMCQDTMWRGGFSFSADVSDLPAGDYVLRITSQGCSSNCGDCYADFPFTKEAACVCTANSNWCEGNYAWHCSSDCLSKWSENCDSYDGCVGTTYRDWYCSGGNCTYTDYPNDSRCVAPNNLPQGSHDGSAIGWGGCDEWNENGCGGGTVSTTITVTV